MEPYEVKKIKHLLITKVEKCISINDTLKTLQTHILSTMVITVPVPANSLRDILQEESYSSVYNERPSCIKKEVRKPIYLFIQYLICIY